MSKFNEQIYAHNKFAHCEQISRAIFFYEQFSWAVSIFFADVSSKTIALADPVLSQPDMEQEMVSPPAGAYVPSFTICHVLPDLPVKVLAQHFFLGTVRYGTERYCTVCWYGIVEFSVPWSTGIGFCMVMYCLFCALVGHGLNVFIGVRRYLVFLCL